MDEKTIKPEDLITNNSLSNMVVSKDESVVYTSIALTAVNMARMEEREIAIQAFIEATDGYFIVGGTDYTHSILESFKSKLSE